MLAVLMIVTPVFLATKITALLETPTAGHRQVVLCSVNIVSRYVSTGQPLMVSVSNGDGFDEYQNLLSEFLEELHELQR
jgi:hypothetical protein